MIRQASSIAVLALLLVGCGDSKTAEKGGEAAKPAASGPELTELGIKDTQVGKGKPVKSGDTAYVRYRGYFKDGKEFDSNMKDGKPLFNFVAGPTGSVIEGWKQGIIGMKEGGKRTLSVPWKMAYGEQGNDTIPGKTDLYFDIELVTRVGADEADVVKKKDVKVGSGPGIKEGQKATVKVRGTLMDGSEIDSSDKFTFTVGKGEVIPGVDAGIVGMKVGGQRELTIPPMAGFGPMGKPPAIQGPQILKYNLTLLKIG